jgi:putative GTP pyrophosphokinase
MLQRFGLAHVNHKEKESGYSSIHYILRLRTGSSPIEEQPWFEMQVRTLAQELWSEMEHILAYKPQGRTDFITRKTLQILSREIGAIDEHFNLLQEQLVQRQDSLDHSREDPLSTENLPSTLAEIGLRCAQQDVHAILNLLSSRGIRSVGALVKTGTPRRVDTIRNTYVSVLGRPPENLEVVATLGALHDIEPRVDETKHILAQIEYNKYWSKFRREKMAMTTNGYQSGKAT